MNTNLRTPKHVMPIKKDFSAQRFYVKTGFQNSQKHDRSFICLSSYSFEVTIRKITGNLPVKKGISSLLVLSTPKAKAMVESFLIEFSRS